MLRYSNTGDMELENHIVRKIVIMSQLHELKAINQDGEQFVVYPLHSKDANMIYSCVNKLLRFYKDNPGLDITDILLNSGIRFSASEPELAVKANGEKVIVNRMLDIPPDIYSFLLKNEYDREIIDAVINDSFYIPYNFVEIITKILKIGKNFKIKNMAINAGNDKTSNNVLDYIIDKYITKSAPMIYSECKKEHGDKFVKDLSETCNLYDISYTNMLYRVHILQMNLKDAIRIGIDESIKYNITAKIGTGSIFTTGVNKVFYNIAREYMKELEKNRNDQ